jgi:dihydropteroate synthase
MQHSIRIGQRLVALDTPKVMGIINATPDSFYDGSRMSTTAQALKLAEKMIEDGADFLDIGGQSTRPGSLRIGSDEELQRVIPIIEAVRQRFPDTILSIDTYHAPVAREAIAAGASMVNDISAWSLDPAMLETVAQLKVPYVLTHMQGRPETMQVKPVYDDVVNDLFKFFTEKLSHLRSHGVADVLLDPGFGFGKRLEDNYALLGRLSEFTPLRCPILAGVSRKGMIYKLLNSTPEKALNGSTAAHVIALLNGASVLRVHDVHEAAEAIKIVTFTAACS